MTALADLVKQLQAKADAWEREAKHLDVEFPEPDDWCSAKGGDAHRRTAALMRDSADRLARLEALMPAAYDWTGIGNENLTRFMEELLQLRGTGEPG